MWMWILLFASSISELLATLYVRPLEAGLTVSGPQYGSETLPPGSTAIDCARVWFNHSVTAVSFSGNACVAYKQIEFIHQTRDTEISAYLLERDTEGVSKCSGNATADAYDLLSCRSGWTKIAVGTSHACYRLITYADYSRIESSQDTYINACKLKWDYSLAASIHSHEEELLIREIFESQTEIDGNGWFGFKIGLRVNVEEMFAWFWIDGSPIDYTGTFKLGTEEYCQRVRCTHGSLFWYPPSDEFEISPGNLNKKDLLCKYNMVKKG